MQHNDKEVGKAEAPDLRDSQRREVLRRFGRYAACTAPAMMVLLSSRQSSAGSFFRKGGGDGGSDGFSA